MRDDGREGQTIDAKTTIPLSLSWTLALAAATETRLSSLFLVTLSQLVPLAAACTARPPSQETQAVGGRFLGNPGRAIAFYFFALVTLLLIKSQC